MLDFLYTLFIAPLEFWMEKTLQWGFDHTQSWGWAIIVMSIVVSTVILPIYLKAEHWQEKERSIRKSFENDEAMIKRTFKGQERFAMITTMHRQAGYSPLLTLRSSIGFFLQIPFFFAAYHFLSHFEPLQGISFLGLSDLSKPDELFTVGGFAINVMPILMTIINIASALIYTQNLSKRDKYQLYGMAAIFLVLLYNAASGLVLYWTFNNVYSLIKNIVIEKTSRLNFAIALPKVSLNLNFLKRFHLFTIQRKIHNWSSLQELFWPATLLWLCLTFIYFPVKLYTSDPITFSFPLDGVVASLIGGCQLVIFVIFLVWFICRGNLRTSLSFLILTVLISSILFAFVFEHDLGAMDAFVFQKPEALKSKWNKFIDVGVIAFAIFLVWCIAKFNLIKPLKNFVTLSLVAVLGFSIFCASPYITNKDHLVTQQQNSNTPPEEVQKLFTFSKNGQNIVVLMLDMFTGGNMKQILAKDPNLSNELDGFIWYPDTMSSGSMTIFGLPGILGGEKLAAYNLLDKNRTETLEETINKEWANFLNYLGDKNYEVSVLEYTWLRRNIIEKYLNSSANLIQSNTMWGKLPLLWSKQHGIEYKSETIEPFKFFYTYGLFKVAPLSKQRKIYKNGKWRHAVHRAYTNQSHALRGLSQLDSLTSLSQVTESQKNQFKFIINELTHVPWSMDEQCLPINTVTENILSKEGTYPAHIQAEYCAIKSVSRWINWLKQNNVYDNTMIFVVSDHGNEDSEQIYTTWNGNPPKVGFHALMLLKGFNQRGKLTIDQSPMANFDVQELILKNMGKVEGLASNKMKRTRCTVLASSWMRSKHASNYFLGTEKICIQENLFEKEGWKISPINTVEGSQR